MSGDILIASPLDQANVVAILTIRGIRIRGNSIFESKTAQLATLFLICLPDILPIAASARLYVIFTQKRMPMLRCNKNKIQSVRLRREDASGLLLRATRISHKTSHKKTWPGVLAMCLAAYASQSWAMDESPSGGAVESDKLDGWADDNKAATHARLWRSLTLSYGSTRHHYREPDPLGRVDPLDSETGSIPTTQATLRWRGKLAQALPEIAMQAQASYAQGQTDYNGYLQQGFTLTPYRTRTGNTLQAYNLRVGLPLNAFAQQHWAQHIAPYAEQSWHHWQRNLTQYSETFTWQTTSIGMMALWPLADLGLIQFSRFTLEADLSTGRTRNPHMTAPALGFAADLGSTSTSSAVLALHYAATPSWLLGLRYEAQRMGLGASPTVAGLQYPGSSNNTRSLAVSFGQYF